MASSPVETPPNPALDPAAAGTSAPVADPVTAPMPVPDTSDAPAVAPQKRGGRRGILFVVLLVVLLGGGYFGYTTIRNNQRFVSTDDALVDSNLVAIASPSAGTLTNWRVQPGDPVRAGQVIGTVRVAPTGGASPLINILAPQDGTILKVDGKAGQIIGANSALAYIADLSTLRITMYIDEADVHRVQPGQPVDIQVDATGSQHYDGTVSEVIPAAASQFGSASVQDRGSGNFTKVTQRVEVHVSLGDTADSGLYPGMNAHAKITVG